MPRGTRERRRRRLASWVTDPRNSAFARAVVNRMVAILVGRPLVAPVDDRYLVADVEGLALAPAGDDGGYLVASSQGDNAYAVFALPDMTPVGQPGPMSTVGGRQSGYQAGHFPVPRRQPNSDPLVM